jgi:hypothetical protein
MTLLYLPMIRFYDLAWGWAFTLPAAAFFYMAATFYSAIKFWSRRGGEWKGRVQDPQDAKSRSVSKSSVPKPEDHGLT